MEKIKAYRRAKIVCFIVSKAGHDSNKAKSFIEILEPTPLSQTHYTELQLDHYEQTSTITSKN